MPSARITTGVAEIILIAIDDHPLIPTASKVGVTYLITFLVFKATLDAVGMSGWSSMAISMISATPVVILALGIASMIIKPSLYKETEKKLHQQQK